MNKFNTHKKKLSASRTQWLLKCLSVEDPKCLLHCGIVSVGRAVSGDGNNTLTHHLGKGYDMQPFDVTFIYLLCHCIEYSIRFHLVVL